MPDATLNLIIAGPEGRMGQHVVAAACEASDVQIVAAYTHPDSSACGTDLGTATGRSAHGVIIETMETALARSPSTDGPVAVIDFTAPVASVDLARTCAAQRAAGKADVRPVIATTGFKPDQDAAIADAAKTVPIVKAGNMSLGVTLLSVLVEQAAARLGADFDIEIAEAHHRAKVDAPSGTGLLLGEAAARGRGLDLTACKLTARDGHTGPRPDDAIGFSVIRGGNIPGDHDVHFIADSEVLTLSHRALDRRLFAKGALVAARWLTKDNHTPKLYDMRDVLGI